jgi:glycosyltransferase involved in cell wall biosynthesis
MGRVLLEIHEGQIVRNLLENGLLGMLTAGENEVLILTPGARVPAFVERFARPHVAFEHIAVEPSLSRWEKYEGVLGSRLNRQGRHRTRRGLWRRWGEAMAARAPQEQALLARWKPDVVVSTHLSQVYGRGLVAAARRRGIPTVGNLMSWDNVWKGLRVRPDVVTCWSENNRQEVCDLAGYEADHVRVIGAPAFDAYLADDARWSRTQVCDRFGLDAARPLLLFATLGQFQQQIDETNPLEVLLRAIDAGTMTGRPQVVLRMHPWSREAYFARFMEHPDVRVSRYENYVPGLGWTPTRDEAVLAGNLLRHADVVVSPGSTMCIEAAIFDTPTVVPVFNEYMPEVFEAYFRRTWLEQHFRRLYKNDWVPVVRSGAAMIAAVSEALADRAVYREGRRCIREEFLGPLDGRATERLAAVILEEAGRM